MHGLSKGLCQLLVSDRIGRSQVNRARNLAMGHQKYKCPYEIFHVDPRKPLISTPEGSSQILSKNRHHLTQCASFFAENNTKTGDNDPRSVLLSSQGLVFPLYCNPGQKVIPGRGFLRELFIPVKPIVAHRRCAEKDQIPPIGGFHRINDIAGRGNSAFHDQCLRLRCPLAEYGCPGKVDNTFLSFEELLPNSCLGRITLHDGCSSRESFRNLFRSTQHRYGMALTYQSRNEISPHKAGATSDENFHRALLPSIVVSFSVYAPINL